MPTYVEIVGLLEANNNRACEQHKVCGQTVVKGSLLNLKPCVIVNESGRNEYAISANIMLDGIETCTVGFVAREFHPFRARYEHKLVQVIELLCESTNTEHRRRSYVNRGIAICVLLNG